MKKIIVEVEVIPEKTELKPPEAQRLLGVPGSCKVISHQVTMNVRYLVELPNGERRWATTPVMR